MRGVEGAPSAVTRSELDEAMQFQLPLVGKCPWQRPAQHLRSRRVGRERHSHLFFRLSENRGSIREGESAFASRMYSVRIMSQFASRLSSDQV